MMYVYGTRKKIKKIRDLGQMTCTNCGHSINAVLAKEVGYCHFCYIPVFPYLMGYKIILCPNCGIMRKLDNEEFQSLQEDQHKPSV